MRPIQCRRNLIRNRRDVFAAAAAVLATMLGVILVGSMLAVSILPASMAGKFAGIRLTAMALRTLLYGVIAGILVSISLLTDYLYRLIRNYRSKLPNDTPSNAADTLPSLTQDIYPDIKYGLYVGLRVLILAIMAFPVAFLTRDVGMILFDFSIGENATVPVSVLLAIWQGITMQSLATIVLGILMGLGSALPQLFAIPLMLLTQDPSAIVLYTVLFIGLACGLIVVSGYSLATRAYPNLWFGVIVGFTMSITYGVVREDPYIGIPATIAAFAIGYSLGFFRVPFMVFEILVQLVLFYLVHRRLVRPIPITRYSPVFWDELIWFRLPGLDHMLRVAAKQDQTVGVAYLSHVAKSFRQHWAARRTMVLMTIDILSSATALSDIQSSLTTSSWLPTNLSELPLNIGEVYPVLQSVAQNVEIMRETDSVYSRRNAAWEALNQLDVIKSRVTKFDSDTSIEWTPVIEQWHKIINRELVQASSPAEAGVENPYQPGNPIQLSRKLLFKGRTDLRDTIVHSLLDRARPTFVLHGPRRMGKTSFLLQLPGLLPGDTIPVFYDLQRPANTDSTASLLTNLAIVIRRSARPYRVIIDEPAGSSFRADPFGAFAHWLEAQTEHSLTDFRLLLCFDEFEKLGEAISKNRVDERVFDELRYMIQHLERVSLLFAGVQTLDELGPQWSSYFINVRPLPISYLERSEAESLLLAPDTSIPFALQYEPGTVDSILSQTHNHPYLIQLVGSCLVQIANAKNTTVIDLDISQESLTLALDQGEPYFRNVWDEAAEDAGQRVLRAIAHEESLDWQNEYPAALNRLIRRHLVSKSRDGYEIEVPLFQRWIIERSPIGSEE